MVIFRAPLRVWWCMDTREHGLGAAARCDHFAGSVPKPPATKCQECGSAFNVRLCETCGHVGCCDSQAGHARVHADETGHAAIYADPQGGGFVWCYAHNRYL
jgi:uncharacterized UBP type Zn finger protein